MIGCVCRHRPGADGARQRWRPDWFSCNGFVGLKPSHGRSELYRFLVGIVANGVLIRSVRDTAALYREVEYS